MKKCLYIHNLFLYYASCVNLIWWRRKNAYTFRCMKVLKWHLIFPNGFIVLWQKIAPAPKAISCILPYMVCIFWDTLCSLLIYLHLKVVFQGLPFLYTSSKFVLEIMNSSFYFIYRQKFWKFVVLFYKDCISRDTTCSFLIHLHYLAFQKFLFYLEIPVLYQEFLMVIFILFNNRSDGILLSCIMWVVRYNMFSFNPFACASCIWGNYFLFRNYEFVPEILNSSFKFI